MDAGSELGFHRERFSGIGFSSLMVVDIICASTKRLEAVHVVYFAITWSIPLTVPGMEFGLKVSVTGCLPPHVPLLQCHLRADY